jgi:hypothetical protein
MQTKVLPLGGRGSSERVGHIASAIRAKRRASAAAV